MANTILSVRDLRVNFSLRGKTLTAVRGASLDLYENETLAIVGESGSGKSVLTKTLIGMTDKNGTIVGGSIGYALKTAISQGVKRGLFSNEAGMGSTPHAHALANVDDPHDQGVVAMAGVFIDTFIVLTMTALVVISTLFTEGGILHGQVLSAENLTSLGVSKTNAAQLAFGSAFGNSSFGNIFVAICLFFFAFSTILGWNLFGRINVNYLFGKNSNLVYSIIAIVFIFLGSVLSNDLVWELTDMFNNLMVIPNVLALVVLSKLVVSACKLKKKNNIEK